MNYEESVRSLLALGRELAAPQQARVQKFGLDNIRVVSAALGNPHLAFPCVHIAGTNGKGSTAAMLESILRASGFKTGLYTSPHLERVNERIRIDGQEISDHAFARAWTEVHQTIESLMASGKLSAHPTFFECVTAMAFLAFLHAGGRGRPAGGPGLPRAQRNGGERDETSHGAGAFLAVYEVGLGGRLDSTNIVEPEASVITPIDFDHENFLGHSIEEIAGEKAGIIKPGGWVASAPQRPEARAVIRRRSFELNARLVETDQMWTLGEIRSSDGRYRATATRRDDRDRSTVSIAPSLPGNFQLQNALAAAAAALLLRERGFGISDDAIAAGIGSARWPGRLERLSDRPALYLDGGHNPAAARELKGFWEANFPGRRIVLIYGTMRDKAVDEIAGLLFPLADHVILTEPRQPRALSTRLLAEMTAGLAPHAVTAISDPAEALELALSAAGPDDVIFATGSLFLVGDLRQYWRTRALGTNVSSPST
ncbi:MAG TPA: folylpolyglutamate synthase/dihydrofolate synthase family protein [Candidatus Cybelea sp.]|nr:folylpolyglutamate synthase/dihydrofolate synthase family protein [Candidatus Cybelea sp.]